MEESVHAPAAAMGDANGEDNRLMDKVLADQKRLSGRMKKAAEQLEAIKTGRSDDLATNH